MADSIVDKKSSNTQLGLSATGFPEGAAERTDIEPSHVEPQTSTTLQSVDGDNEKGYAKGGVAKGDVEVTVKTGPPLEEDYPDGGLQAWLVVLGAMCTTFSTFGYVNSWGIFQGYYQETILKNETTSNIAWIGSVQYALIFIPGLFVGRLFDLGYFRSVFLVSSCLLVASTFLVPLCTQYWHFLLCQGFAVGISCGCLFGPTPAVVAHWFKVRRGISMGMVAIGSSLGGTIMPILSRSLLPKVGFAWTMRIYGFIFMGSLGLANLLMKRRLPPRDLPGGLFNWRVFKSAPFSVYSVSCFVTFLGIYTMLTYVSVSATRIGISNDFSFYFVAMANAASLFGRYAAGYICDSVGPINVMVPFTASAGILTYAWPYAQSKESLIAVTVLYGFASGVYVSILTNPIFEFGETGDVGRRVGMFMIPLGLGAIAGPPISGAILTASGGFKAVGYYAGTMVLLGVGLMCLARHLVLRRLIGKL